MNQIRRATKQDISGILNLLLQVDLVHHKGRPDLFMGPATKYGEEELLEIISQEETPVFVCVDEQDRVNPGAMQFYEKMGLLPQKVTMECLL